MKIAIIGTGLMAIEYAKVLKGLNESFIVIGRGEKNASAFYEATQIKAFTGGLTANLKQLENIKHVINAVGIESLKEVTIDLLNANIENILLEKPGVAYPNEINEITELANRKKANIVLAYNRRFYQSTIKARELIEQDGGVVAFNFEFTEWAHQIETIKHLKTRAELENWFLGNSTHVIDLAFYLGGTPKELNCYVAGKDKIEWHPKSSSFSGSGVSDKNALFAYSAHWQTPGRFVLEVLTTKNRYIFKPLEKLQVQKLGTVAVNFYEDIDYNLDEVYKPGFYLQTKAFLENDLKDFVSLAEQAKLINGVYKQMSGY